MAITASQRGATNSTQSDSGAFLDTAVVTTVPASVTTGFQPVYVCWENATDRTRVEWFQGMAANSCIKTAATGARTLETGAGNGGITVTANGFTVSSNAVLAANASSKQCHWSAIGG